MPRARPNRYTQVQLEADLRRIMQRLRADSEERGELRYPDDDDLAGLCALARIVGAVDYLIDRHIAGARRGWLHGGVRRPGPPVSWARIGAALGISGQAAGKRARSRGLVMKPPAPMTEDRYRQLVAEGRRLVAQLGRGRRPR